MNPSLVVQVAPLGNRTRNGGLLEIVDNVKNLMEENLVLDEKMERLCKKKKENLRKVSVLIEKIRGFGDDHAEDNGDQNLVGDNYDGLKEEENILVQKIAESTKNLRDHKNLLKDLDKEAGHDENWKEQYEKVQKYQALHHKYKISKELRLEAIRHELRRIECGDQGAVAGTSSGSVGRKKMLKEKFVMHQAAASTSGEAGSSRSPISPRKRMLNESVLDCGLIKKKISLKEKDAMVPKVLKIEEPSPPNPHECNFCGKSFTSAAPLASHLVKHYTQFAEKFDCPFPTCNFAATQENLTKHMRSKHTKEQMFSCSHCTIKFYTMDAKMSHEKKHGQPAVWAQCDQPACLMFYQVARGSCRCAK